MHLLPKISDSPEDLVREIEVFFGADRESAQRTIEEANRRADLGVLQDQEHPPKPREYHLYNELRGLLDMHKTLKGRQPY